MRTIIIEGIATSGKTTVINLLEKELSTKYKIKIVPEHETITVIEGNTSKKTSAAHLKKLIEKTFNNDYDFVIFDRLYLTHIFRTSSSIDDFLEIEEKIKQFYPITVYLKVNEDVIAERVRLAAEHRHPEWKRYIKTKGSNYAEIADYYIGQQRNQLKLLNNSAIEFKIYDTTNHKYEEIVNDILTILS